LLESIDSRILGTYFANGNIWGVLGTGLSVGGELRAMMPWIQGES